MSPRSLAALGLNRLTRRQRQALLSLDLLWPDSRALLLRVAERLRRAAPGAATEAAILRMLQAAAEAFLATRPGDDYERFGACVDALTQALERPQGHLVAQALSARQRGYLARRLPPTPEARARHGD
jgi:hypothetical protein